MDHPDSVQHETLEGQVLSVVFQAEDSGFAVVVLESDGSTATAAGDIGPVNAGDYLRLHGRWTDHPRFGRQFQAGWSEQTTPTTLHGLGQYLASGSFPGIGADMSKRLIRHFGENTLEALEGGAKTLQAVSGIGPKRAQVLAEAFAEGRARHRVLAELRGFGLNGGQANALYENWQAGAIERVKADPYALIGALRGIGFATAERMAHQLGIPRDSVVRARGVLLHLLREAGREGHTCLPEDELNRRSSELGLADERLTEALAELIQQRRLVCEVDVESGGETRDYLLPDLHAAETALAGRVRELLKGGAGSEPGGGGSGAGSEPGGSAALATPEQVMEGIRRADFPPDPSQSRALELSLREPFGVITGGPGTGKTTTLRLVLDILDAVGVGPVKLASPTGRAAKRLHEATGREASTVHRLLGFEPHSGTWRHDADNPLDAAFLIVDEVSMLDLPLAAALFAAVPPKCRVLLVGDADQLPSVGPGSVLRDLVASPAVPTVRLQRIHRQGEGSGITEAAHRILEGALPQTMTSPGGDFYLVTARSPDAAADLVERIVCERIPERFGLDPRSDVLVLAPMYRGPVGVHEINARLSRRLNPDGAGSEWAGSLRVGDRVMVVRNDYEREVFNGDAGLVTAIENDRILVEIDRRVLEYGRDELDQLIPAWCVTVHRSQGSEARAVVIVLGSSHYMMLRRNLLYTAVTRGKEVVTVVADPHALRRAVSNADESQRWTRLRQRLDADGSNQR